MIHDENLDIRTITMGISLRDCCHQDGEACRQRIYDKITRCAEDLVRVGEDIEKEYGIPIINKRISVTPIALVAESSDETDYAKFAQIMDREVGDIVEFGGLLGTAPVMRLNSFGSGDFIRRGGRIPAPITSLRN